MNTLKKQAIAQALRENFTAYPEYYAEDAIFQLVNWVESEYQVDEEKDKGSLDEWLNIAIDEYLDYFNVENRECIIDQINSLRKNKIMKTYRIIYAYGGRFLGDSISNRDIKAESKERAVEIFKKEYLYEKIYSVFEKI